jgi:hypothetical protein
MNRIITLLNTGRIAAASMLVLGLPSADVLAASQSVANADGYNVISMKDDLAHHSLDIHWPAGFEPATADLFAHNHLLINASCERVWSRIIEASRWPTWYPNSKDVEIQGDDPVLRDGTLFRWTTFGLAIESKVHEYKQGQEVLTPVLSSERRISYLQSRDPAKAGSRGGIHRTTKPWL